MSSCTGTYLFHDDGYKYRVPKKGLATITTSSDHEKETTILVRVYVMYTYEGSFFQQCFFYIGNVNGLAVGLFIFHITCKFKWHGEPLFDQELIRYETSCM